MYQCHTYYFDQFQTGLVLNNKITHYYFQKVNPNMYFWRIFQNGQNISRTVKLILIHTYSAFVPMITVHLFYKIKIGK